MSERFMVGDVAIIIGGVHAEWIGKEATIMSPLEDHNFFAPDGRRVGPAHRITHPIYGGRTAFALPEHLRKKRPPREDWKIVSWDTCPWQPESVRHGT